MWASLDLPCHRLALCCRHEDQLIADDPPGSGPGHRVARFPRQRGAGHEVGRLAVADGRIQTCELHRRGARVGRMRRWLILSNGPLG